MHYGIAVGWLETSLIISLFVCGLANHFGLSHKWEWSILSRPTRESNSALDAHRCTVVARHVSDARSQRHYGWQMVALLVILCIGGSFVYVTHKPAFVERDSSVGCCCAWDRRCLERLVLRGFRSMGLLQTDREKWRSYAFLDVLMGCEVCS